MSTNPATESVRRTIGLLRSRGARQSGGLLIAQSLSTLLSFAFTILLTRGLDVGAYGAFRYAMTFLALALMLMQLGWPYSAARVLATEPATEVQREIVGACAILVLVSSVVGGLVTIAALQIAALLGQPLPTIVSWMVPFTYITLGQYMIRNICQGLNRIKLLAAHQVLPYVILLPVTALQIYVLNRFSLGAAIGGYVAVFSVMILAGFAQLGIRFSNLRPRLATIFAENRRTGLPIYVGGVFGVASAHGITLAVAEFVDPVRYGQYALAVGVATPLSILVSSVGTVIFRSSVGRVALSRSTLWASLLLGLALMLCFVVGAELFLVAAFGAEYAPSVRMAEALGVSALLVGWGDILQRFLGANGYGRALALSAVAAGTVGTISAVLILPTCAVYGAIACSVLVSGVYFAAMVMLYLRHGKIFVV